VEPDHDVQDHIRAIVILHVANWESFRTSWDKPKDPESKSLCVKPSRNFSATIEYNERLQPFEHAVSRWMGKHLSRTYQFNAPGGGNNGNVWGIADHVNAAYTQQFDYDFRNRITLFTSNGLGSMTFDEYDRWGNRRKQCGSGGAPTMNPTVGTNNRATARRTDSCVSTPNQPMGYDAAGNPTSEPGRTHQYDGEGWIKSVDSGATATYAYDGDGRRARKVSGGQTRHYFYDPEGNAVFEHVAGIGWETFNLYINGRHPATNNTVNGLLFRHPDHLGSPRLLTTPSGGIFCSMLFYPYGEATTLNCSQAADKRRFTGKERDAETGLDYFGARYYANTLGRFTAVDPARESADPENPQTWNRYAYTLNDPLKYVDPDGESATLAGGLIGGIVRGVTAAAQGKTWSEIGAAAAGGAVTGAMIGSVIDTGGASLLAMAGAGAFAVAAGGATERAILGQEHSATAYAVDLSAGAAAGLMAPALAGGSTRSGLIQPAPPVSGAPSRSVAEQAQALSQTIGRHRVTVQTPDRRLQFDLRGKAHFGTPTPHVHTATRNVGPSGKVNYSDRKVRPATQNDIRTVRRYLRKGEDNEH
jgi:RHS repeat-associated protein